VRKSLKLLLLLGIGLAMSTTKGGGNGPSNTGNGTPTPTTSDGTPAKDTDTDGDGDSSSFNGINAGTDGEAALNAAAKAAEDGKPKDADGNGEPEVTDSSDPEQSNAGPPVDPDDHLPESDSIVDHVNERWDQGATDHYVKDVPRAQLPQYVDNVLNGKIPGIDPKNDIRYLDRGRVAYWDPNTGAVVIEDPGSDHGGTVFTPTEGRDYFEDLE
jgi:hypothetical protein